MRVHQKNLRNKQYYKFYALLLYTGIYVFVLLDTHRHSVNAWLVVSYNQKPLSVLLIDMSTYYTLNISADESVISVNFKANECIGKFKR